MNSNMAESFWEWCHLNSIQGIFWVKFLYFSISGFFMNFYDFWVFGFRYRPQNENLEIMENLHFWVYKVQMHMNLFFDHCFNFWGAKTKMNKNVLNLINVDGLETFKIQTPGTWLEICVNHFEFDVIWRTSELFLKLHSHNSVLWHFCSISVISEFSYSGVELKTKTQKLQFFFLKLYQICFCVYISLFLLVEFVIPLFNCYFRDFCRFHDFRVVDLAQKCPGNNAKKQWLI